MKCFIITQKKLAEEVGCTEKHLSNVKNRKARVSVDLAKKLEATTGIEAFAWVTSSKPTLRKKMREFFESQKIAEQFHSTHVVGGCK